MHLVRDILKLEHEPLNEVLKVDSLRPDQDGAENIHVPQQMASNVNTNFTKSGRPINNHPQKRWKPIVNKLAVPFNSAIEEGVDKNVAIMAANTNIDPSVHQHQKSAANVDISELLTDVAMGKKQTLTQFRLAGNSLGAMSGYGRMKNTLDELGRPVPTEIEIDDPVRGIQLASF